MLTTVRSTVGPVGREQFPRRHADVRVVTVTTISTPDTTFGPTTAMVSKVRVVQEITSTGTGVSSIYSFCLEIVVSIRRM